jgi:hypothetical protein
MLTFCLATGTAQASLLGRSALTEGGTDYQAYYDDAQNITWVADANLAASNAFGVADISGGWPAGDMSWTKVNEWIAAMNTASYLGASNWRLPTTLLPDPTCQYGSSYGRYCTGSEMGHLGNVDGIVVVSPTPFTNVKNEFYWSGTSAGSNSQWGFHFAYNNEGVFYFGQQLQIPITFDHYYAWAVRDGDIAAVPVPPAVWLFGSALGVMGVLRRKLSS